MAHRSSLPRYCCNGANRRYRPAEAARRPIKWSRNRAYSAAPCRLLCAHFGRSADRRRFPTADVALPGRLGSCGWKSAVWPVREWSLTTRRVSQTDHLARSINVGTKRTGRRDRDSVMVLNSAACTYSVPRPTRVSVREAHHLLGDVHTQTKPAVVRRAAPQFPVNHRSASPRRPHWSRRMRRHC